MTGGASTPDPLAEILSHVVGVGTKCLAGEFIPSLSKERLDAIETALARVGRPGDKMTMTAIGKALQLWGFQGQPSAAARHLAGRCACPR